MELADAAGGSASVLDLDSRRPDRASGHDQGSPLGRGATRRSTTQPTSCSRERRSGWQCRAEGPDAAVGSSPGSTGPYLDHIALTARPAYLGAKILEVSHGSADRFRLDYTEPRQNPRRPPVGELRSACEVAIDRLPDLPHRGGENGRGAESRKRVADQLHSAFRTCCTEWEAAVMSASSQ